MIKRLVLFLAFLLPAICYSQENYKVIESRGNGKVCLKKYQNGQWQLFVDNKPYFIKGVVYEPVIVGQRLTESNMWMNYDFNSNGKNDTAYDSWVDKNNNNIQDADEKPVGDFQLLKEMGCNTIRVYHPLNINKNIFRDLYNRFGIRIMLGNFIGAYTWGSGASWEKGTDYTDPEQRKKMMEDVRKMVLEYKDEPFVLLWMLGNENDAIGSAENSTLNKTNASMVPEDYAKFVNEVAKMIHDLDPDHPVGVCNAHFKLLKYYANFSPEIDIIGMNAYTGAYGFGSLWNAVKMDFDRPVVITEYGVDCYDQNKNTINEDFQAKYYKGSWRNMIDNSYGHTGVGNSIGGFAYIWLDSWWLSGSIDEHDTVVGAWNGPAIDSWMNDEWMGICSQADGKSSPFLRQLRKVYYMFQKEWRDS